LALKCDLQHEDKQSEGDETGKRSVRLVAKPTVGCTTMEKVWIVLLKKSGILEEDATPQAADLQRYKMCYKKPLAPAFVDGVGPRCSLIPPP
jgi:hypothetical protein